MVWYNLMTLIVVVYSSTSSGSSSSYIYSNLQSTRRFLLSTGS